MSEKPARNEPLVDAAQLATELGVRKQYVYLLVKQGLPCLRVGRRRYLRFDRAEVRDWLETADPTG